MTGSRRPRDPRGSAGCATTLKSLLGISIPTTVLPGIGASIRIVRAASAIARSSARPSIRLTLTDGSGSTSYWVTTGPAFHLMTRLGMLKLASLPAMIAAFRSWSMPRPDSRAATSSSSVTGGRRYSRGSRRIRRVRRVGNAVRSARRDQARRLAIGRGGRCHGDGRPRRARRHPPPPAKTAETCAGPGSGTGISGRAAGSRATASVAAHRRHRLAPACLAAAPRPRRRTRRSPRRPVSSGPHPRRARPGPAVP